MANEDYPGPQESKANVNLESKDSGNSSDGMYASIIYQIVLYWYREITIYIIPLYIDEVESIVIPQKRVRKAQHHWNSQWRIQLLRAIELPLPFTTPHKKKADAWEKVANDYNSAIGKPNTVDSRSVSEKFKTLLKQFCKDEGISLKASGTEEEYTEQIQLLTGLAELKNDSKLINNAQAIKNKQKVSIFNLELYVGGLYRINKTV